MRRPGMMFPVLLRQKQKNMPLSLVSAPLFYSTASSNMAARSYPNHRSDGFTSVQHLEWVLLEEDTVAMLELWPHYWYNCCPPQLMNFILLKRGMAGSAARVEGSLEKCYLSFRVSWLIPDASVVALFTPIEEYNSDDRCLSCKPEESLCQVILTIPVWPDVARYR